MKTIVRLAATAALLLVRQGEAQVPSQLVGKWLGTAGTPLDRVEIGFEFTRDSTGQMVAFLYLPVENFYGLNAGYVQADSGRLLVRNWVLSLTLESDTLKGAMFFNRVPVLMTRTRTLPAEKPVPKIAAAPPPRWQLKLGAPIYAAPVIDGAVAYIGTSSGLFHAIDVGTGVFRWTFAAGRPIHGAATVTDSAVFFVSDNGYLYKLDRAKGTEVWKYDLGDARVPRVLMHQVIPNAGPFDWDLAAPTPVLRDDVLYVGSGDGSMHAVSADSGKQVWKSELRGKIRGTAVVTGSRVFVASFAGFVYALDLTSGAKRWEWQSSGPVVSSVALIGDRLVVGNRFGVLAAIDTATGRPAWRSQLWGSSAESEAVPAGGSTFYFGSSDLRRVAKMDVNDGRVFWRTDVLGWAWARPVVADSLLLVSTVGAQPYQMRHLGGLVALDRYTGHILWRYPMPDLPGVWGYGFFAPVAVGERAILAAGLDGTLYAFPR